MRKPLHGSTAVGRIMTIFKLLHERTAKVARRQFQSIEANREFGRILTNVPDDYARIFDVIGRIVILLDVN